MTTPLTPHNLVYDLAPAADPHVSPEGTHVLYSVSRADPATSGETFSSLWLCGIDGDAPRRLTWHDGRAGGARWSPDGSHVAFIANRDSGRGISLLPLAGGEARELTKHRKPIESLAWAPDGRHLAYSALVDPANPDEIELPEGAAPPVRVTRRSDYKQDNRGYLGDERNQIVVADVATGERRQVTREPVDHLFPQWSPDGQTIAVRIPVDVLYSQLGLIDVATGALRRIGPEHGVVGIWAWSPDGDRIVFAGDTTQTWQLDFFVHDRTTDETHQITDDLPCLPHAGYPTLVPPSQPVWLDANRVLFHAIRAGASGVYLLDVTTGEVTLEQSWIALHTGLSIDQAHRYVVQGHASLERTGEIAVFDRESGETAIISHQNDALLHDAPPARWERFAIRRGPFEVEAWMLKPADFDPSRRYPVILDVHGGPNNYYGYGFNPLQQLLASNGFVVVYANPRGSASYGRHFTQQVTTDWGGEDFLDLMTALDTALDRPYLDRDRTGLYGYSYGGYMTAWALGQTDRFRAAVCGAPCFDLESMYGTSDIGRTFGGLQWGGPPHELPEWFAAHSPSTFAHRIQTPTLIVHGESDHRCPIGQGEQMFTALHNAGCEVEFVRYPGAAHLFLTTGPPGHREDFLERTLAWFKSHLGGPA